MEKNCFKRISWVLCTISTMVLWSNIHVILEKKAEICENWLKMLKKCFYGSEDDVTWPKWWKFQEKFYQYNFLSILNNLHYGWWAIFRVKGVKIFKTVENQDFPIIYYLYFLSKMSPFGMTPWTWPPDQSIFGAGYFCCCLTIVEQVWKVSWFLPNLQSGFVMIFHYILAWLNCLK